MRYKISGESLPVVSVILEKGESITCEAGSMSWMDSGIQMETKAGGLGKMFGRALTNESMFENRYTANSAGEITFASKFPGSIQAVEITPSSGIIVQKGSYLAHFGNIDSEIFINKKMSGGLFGGEGFLMRKFTGEGIIFLEIDGSAHTYELAAGEKKIVNTGHVAYMSDTCTLDIQSIKGVGNVLFGGEGFFNTIVTGPGTVSLQSMPIQRTATALYRYMPHPTSNN